MTPAVKRREFFTALWPAPKQGQIVLWRLSDKRSAWTSLQELVDASDDLSQATDQYFTVCAHNQAIAEREVVAAGKAWNPETHRGTNRSACAMPGFWADIDCAEGTHAAKNLPTREQALNWLLELPMPPSIIVWTGGGFHAYWLLESPFVFASDDDRTLAAALVQQFQAALRCFAGTRSWHLDSTADLARVLRVPGTLNGKFDPPRAVTVDLIDPNRRYSISKIRDWIASVPGAVQEVTHSAHSDAADHVEASAELIANECAWFRHTREDAATLGEPEWFAMLSILGLCKDGDRLAQDLSRPHPGYDEGKTAAKLKHATESAGPRTCKNVRDKLGGEPYCAACPHWAKVRSPLQLGRVDLDRAHNILGEWRAKSVRDQKDAAFGAELLAAAALLARHQPAALDDFREDLKGSGISLKTWNSKLAESRKQSQALNHGRELSESKSVSRMINVSVGQLRFIVDQVWQVLLDLNRSAPWLFLRQGSITEVISDCDGVRLQRTSRERLLGWLSRVVNWVRASEQGLGDARPDHEVARDMLAHPHADLPAIQWLVDAPVFSPTGKPLLTPKYYPDEKIYFASNREITLPPVPERPSAEDLRDARALIDDAIHDFPFASQADRAMAYAMIVLPVVRLMIDGCVPNHLVDAPSPGTGKSYLCKLVSVIAMGEETPAGTLPKNDEEMRKRITSILLAAPRIVLFDNVEQGQTIDSQELSALLTTRVWVDRMLGTNEAPRLPNQAVWLTTGNNIRLSMELARRTVRIRLDARLDRPWERGSFRHKDFLAWAKRERPLLLHAVFVFVQSWIAAGRPEGTRSLASFEEWSAVVGGILQVIGVTGFLENQDRLYQDADAEGEAWRQFVGEWSERFGSTWKRASELWTLCDEKNLLAHARGEGLPHAQLTRLGRQLMSQVDRVYDGLRIEVQRGGRSGGQYRLVPNLPKPNGNLGEPPGNLGAGGSPTQTNTPATTCDMVGNLGNLFASPARKDPTSSADPESNGLERSPTLQEVPEVPHGSSSDDCVTGYVGEPPQPMFPGGSPKLNGVVPPAPDVVTRLVVQRQRFARIAEFAGQQSAKTPCFEDEFLEMTGCDLRTRAPNQGELQRFDDVLGEVERNGGGRV